MKRSKILFLILSLIFLTVIVFILFDFSRKTAFPGSNIELNQESPADSAHE